MFLFNLYKNGHQKILYVILLKFVVLRKHEINTNKNTIRHKYC